MSKKDYHKNLSPAAAGKKSPLSRKKDFSFLGIKLFTQKSATYDDDFFEEKIMEPNMKLSHAFLIVILLHIVAVGGLLFFNHRKSVAMSANSSTPPPQAITAISANEHDSSASLLTRIFSFIQRSQHHPTEEAPLTTKSSNLTPPLEQVGVSEEPLETPSSISPPRPTHSPSHLKTEKSSLLTQKKGTSWDDSLKSIKTPSKQYRGGHHSIYKKSEKMHSLPPSPSLLTYKVRHGDTLYKIAHHFHTSPTHLLQLNHLTHPNQLLVGKKLIVGHASKKSSHSTHSTHVTNRAKTISSTQPHKTPTSANHRIQSSSTLE